jgi:WD40 repeat protein
MRAKAYATAVHEMMRERRHQETIRQKTIEARAELRADATPVRPDGPCLTLSFHSGAGSGYGHLSSTEYEHTVQLWDWAAPRQIRSMPELSTSTTLVAIATAPDGKHVAAGCLDGSVAVYRSVSGELVERLHASGRATADEPTLCVAYSPDGRRLATGNAAGEISIWEIVLGTCLDVWEAHAGYVLSLAFGGTDGQLLASGGQDQCVRVWSASPSATLQLGCQQRVLHNVVTGLGGPVLSLRFNGDGSRIYTGLYAGGRVELRREREQHRSLLSARLD